MQLFLKSFFVLLLLTIKVWGAENPPFIYLSQYYTYEYVNNSSFKINNALYSFENLTILETANSLQITTKNIFLFKTDRTQIEFFNLKNKIIKTFAVKDVSVELNETFDLDPKNISAVCLTAKNEFTTKKMCKKYPLTPSQNTENLVFSVNGVKLSRLGQIILNDKNMLLNFRSETSNYFFEILTSYKNVIINRATKMEKANALQVDFVELNQPNKYYFKNKILLSDTFFEIAIDNLITVYQDIAFPDADLLNQSVDYEFKNWKIRHYNKLGLEPIVLYSRLVITSSSLNAAILSDLSKGIKVYSTHYPSNVLEYYYSGKLMQLQLLNDTNNTTINTRNFSLITLEGGVRYYLSANFHYDLNLTLQELVYAEHQTSTNSIDMPKGISPSVGLSVSSILLEIQKWRLQANGGLGLIAPTGIPSGQTKMAYSLSLGSQISYKLRSGRFYYGFDYLKYSTGNNTYTYDRQSLEHKIGFYYLY